MSFDVSADAYDRFMGSWSGLLAPQLADLAGIGPGQRAIDVGCGPGALTTELVSRLGADQVVAVDPSESFVAAARERHPGVDIRRASAEALPYPDDRFDAALAQLVVHFMTDPVAGLREMARVTRAGGVVACCVWDYASGRGALGPFWEASRALDPHAVDESRLAGARQGHLVELLRVAGLREIEEAALSVSRDFASFDDWWEPFTHGVGPAGVYLGRLEPARRAQLRERCRAALTDGRFSLKAVAWAARGLA
ncbi:MAG: methyltransferase domain-containing protein [Chloroflexota bacterium]|nr:methyltransferase domain-containing protein [Chloroflexota bacterium]